MNPGFEHFSHIVSPDSFEAESAPACIVDVAGCIAAVNAAWNEFARENGGSERVVTPEIEGTRWADHILGDEPRELAETALRRALASTLGLPDIGPVYRFECDTPTHRRIIAARFTPLCNAGAPAVGVLLTYALESEGPLVGPVCEAAVDAFVGPDGFIRQCSSCRRVVDPASGTRRFVRALVEKADPRVSHGMCETCIDLWYGVHLG